MYVLLRTCGTLAIMEVPITQFRRDIFSLVNKAIEGDEVWVTHKGRRLKLVPEGQPVDRLSRITPMEIINCDASLMDDAGLLAEMTRAWEEDWDRDFGPAPEIEPPVDRNG